MADDKKEKPPAGPGSPAGLPATLEQAARAAVPLPREGLTLLDEAGFARAMRLAEMMAEAHGLPGFYNRSPGTCLAAIEDGLRLGISPFVVARMSYQVTPNSPLAYYGKFVTAIINGSPDVVGTLSFEHKGDWSKVTGKTVLKESRFKKDEHGNPTKYRTANWKDEDEEGLSVIVRGTLRETGEVKELELFMVQCWPRNSTLWGVDPPQQICYVAARRWADRHAPHILMGINLAEEMPGEMIDISPQAAAAPQARPAGSKLDAVLDSYKASVVPIEHTVAHDADGVVQEGVKPRIEIKAPELETRATQDSAPKPLHYGTTELDPDQPDIEKWADEARQATRRSTEKVMVTFPGKGDTNRQIETTIEEGSRQLLLKAVKAADSPGALWCERVLSLNPWIASDAVTFDQLTSIRAQCAADAAKKTPDAQQ